MLAGPMLGSIILIQFAAAGFTGTSLPQLSQAIGNGVVMNVLSSAIYTGTSTGLGIGAGISTGMLSGGVCIGAYVGLSIQLQMMAMGLTGTQASAFAMAVGNGVAAHMVSAIVQGTSTVVGIGAGTGTIVGIVGPAMGAMILTQMMAMSLTGTQNVTLANAVGNGVAQAFTSTIATTTITGAAVGVVPPGFPPIPSVGVDTGKLI
jgi:hypothetical protein